MNTLQEKILGAANCWLSATAIAQKVGKHKAYQVIEDIEALVSSGELEKNTNGKFPTYRKAVRATVQSPVRQAASETVSTELVTNQSLPDGYTASKPCVRKTTGQRGRIFTIPGGRKIFVEEGYSLVVINGEPVKSVKTPVSALSVIQKYAEENSMSNFTVRQSKLGTVGKPSDITSFGGVIDLTLTKNNKAA